MMKRVLAIEKSGYKALQSNIVDEMAQMGLTSMDAKEAYLSKQILVKEDKKHRCYHFAQLFDSLKSTPAGEFALAIRGKPENLGCETAYELLFTGVSTRF